MGHTILVVAIVMAGCLGDANPAPNPVVDQTVAPTSEPTQPTPEPTPEPTADPTEPSAEPTEPSAEPTPSPEPARSPEITRFGATRHPVAPLFVTFHFEFDMPTMWSFDAEGDGKIDHDGNNSGKRSFAYAAAGVYDATLRVGEAARVLRIVLSDPPAADTMEATYSIASSSGRETLDAAAEAECPPTATNVTFAWDAIPESYQNGTLRTWVASTVVNGPQSEWGQVLYDASCDEIDNRQALRGDEPSFSASIPPGTRYVALWMAGSGQADLSLNAWTPCLDCSFGDP